VPYELLALVFLFCFVVEMRPYYFVVKLYEYG